MPRAHRAARTKAYAELGCRHCEERSDEAIHTFFAARWIASLALAMTGQPFDNLNSLTSSLRKQGPITTVGAEAVRHRTKNARPRRMGPRLRGDDIERLKRLQHRLRDIRRAVAAAELHRLDALGIDLVDRALDALAGFRRGFEAVLVGEPVQHHRGRKNHSGRFGLAL